MRPVKADLTNLDEVISKQYEDKIRGIVKDSMQNSWEARKHRKKGTGFRIIYRFSKKIDSYRNVLMIEDFGTTGMNKKRWEAFHAHWRTTKGDYRGGIGRWGQGKTLFLYFSSTNRILTESIDTSGTYRYSIRTNVGYLQSGDKPSSKDPAWVKNPDGSMKLIEDFFPSESKLNHRGTRIWILDVKKELAEEMVIGYLPRQLSESWWELIRNYGVNIEVRINRKTTKIGLPDLPPQRDGVMHERIPIGSGHGKIRKLKIALAKVPIPDSLRGIAIQRGGMTVCRHPLPSSIPEDIRETVSGYCMMDDRLDEEMWEIELANHEGFEARRTVWVDLRRKIDSLADDFLSRYTKGKKPESLPIELDEIIRTVNKLIEEHLGGFGPGEGTTHPDTLPHPPPPPVRISPWGYLGSSKRFDAKDVMKPNGAVRNRTSKSATVNLKARIENSRGTVLWSYNINNLSVGPKSKRALVFPSVTFSALTISKGRHSLRGEIRDNKRNLLHRRTAIFYFGRDPPQTKKGWLKKLLFGRLGGPKANLRNLPINSKGELVVNTAYPELDVIWRSRKLGKRQKARKLEPIITNIALHEAMREVSITWWKDDSIDYDIDEIRRAKDLFDEMWAAYLMGT